MKEFYTNTRFQQSSLALIDSVNTIIDEYLEQNFRLTVRQIYYQLVARDIIPNTIRAYQRLTSIVNDGRLAGLIDWDAIEDRTRVFQIRSRWSDAKSLMEIARDQFHMDMWANQAARVVLIVEKQALENVFEAVTHEFDVPLLAARGYPSISALREFAKRQVLYNSGQRTHILHFGDHDPSGIDMSRDLIDRMTVLTNRSHAEFELHRIALNMDQVRKQRPPPNPAKEMDSRFADYAKKFGTSSWELDALSPKFLAQLARTNIQEFIDEDAWDERTAEIERQRGNIAKAVKLVTDKPKRKVSKPRVRKSAPRRKGTRK